MSPNVFAPARAGTVRLWARPGLRNAGIAAAWLVSLAALAGAFAVVSRSPAELPVNADILSPAAIYDDLFVSRYDPRMYQHAAANTAVPDVAVYFAVRAVTGSAGKAVIAWYYALFGVLVAAAAVALRGAAGPAARGWAGPAAVLAGAVYVAAVAVVTPVVGTEANLLLIPVHHAGAQACGFVALGLTARYLRPPAGGAGKGQLAGLAAVCAAAAFSDRLFGLYFAAPIGFTVVVLRVAGSPGLTWRRAAAVWLAVGGGCGAGVLGIAFVPNPGVGADPIGIYTGPVPIVTDLPAKLGKLAAAARTEFFAGNVLVIAAAGWAAAAGLRVANAARTRTPPGLYDVYGLAAFAAVTAGFTTSAVGGWELAPAGHNWASYSRYFIGPEAVGVFGWAGLAAAAAGAGGWRRAVAVCVPTAALGGLLLAAPVAPPRPDDDPFDKYPDYVRVIDDACRKYDMTDGIAGYWQAKPATLYSRAGVRVHAVDWRRGAADPVRPYVWLSNADWYFRRPGRATGPPRFQFVLAFRGATSGSDRDFTVADVVRHLGPPAEEIRAAVFSVLVYDRPADGKLAALAAGDPHFIALHYRTRPPRLPRPGAAVWFDGASFAAAAPHEDVGTSRVAVAPRHPGGFVAYGPHVPPGRPGRYYADFRLTTVGGPGPVADIDVYDGGPGGPVAAAEVPAGVDCVVRLEFDVPADRVDCGLEFRVVFRGTGRLRFDGVAFGLVDIPGP